MAENSKIEWTDHTFNPWRGCTKVSPGCANCYAETLSKRNPAVLGEWGRGKPRVLASEAMWVKPLEWAKHAPYFVQCTNCGSRFDQRNPAEGHACHYKWQIPARPRVFCASLADWLDDEVPIEWLERLVDLITNTPSLDWLLLTKRPQHFFDRVGEATALSKDNIECPSNVWIGTSVEDQARADERIPQLLKIPAKVRFLSCEPLLGPVDLRLNDEFPGADGCYEDARHGLHWVIAGGESGPQARPMHPDWARSLRDQCEAAGVPFLFKQWGEWVYPQYADPEGSFDDFPNAVRGEVWRPWRGNGRHGYDLLKLGKERSGRLLDGHTWDQFPNSATPATTVGESASHPHPQS